MCAYSFFTNVGLIWQLINQHIWISKVYTDLDNGQALLAALFNESLFIYLLSIKVL